MLETALTIALAAGFVAAVGAFVVFPIAVSVVVAIRAEGELQTYNPLVYLAVGYGVLFFRETLQWEGIINA